MSSIEDFLKRLPFFAGLPSDDLRRLCDMVDEVNLDAKEELFAEGGPGDRAYIIRTGQVEIIKNSAGQDVLLAIRQAGDVIGEMSLLEDSPRSASARARTPSRLIAISKDQFDKLLDSSSSAARAILHTVTARLRSTEGMLRQSDKMAELGTLAAGIAHELNNPASAVQRGSVQLYQACEHLQEILFNPDLQNLNSDQLSILSSINRKIKELSINFIEIDPLLRSDLEAEAEMWLEDHHYPDAWEVAPALINLGYTPIDLDNFGQIFQGEALNGVLDWISTTATIHSLLAELSQGGDRITDIVNAMKQYVYLDQAPIQKIDLHDGLNNTLILLRSKLKTGINIRRDYDLNLPQIQAYGSELNQVWTNIIDNAYDAMEGKGDLTIRTRQEKEWVIVEIEDNGPGIPETLQSRIFDPFFTTKEPGKGTGLGLNISYNIVHKHNGTIRVISRPGKTCFEIRLPIDFEKIGIETNMITPLNQPDDDTLRQIINDTETIAVVGLSDREETYSNSVSAYLQKTGFRIIPVNPRIKTVLGERAYPDLISIPLPVDMVLLFRRSEDVPPHVQEAIQIGTKYLWMQEGIIHEKAALTAQEAGILVVMDTCLRTTHRRLIKPDESNK